MSIYSTPVDAWGETSDRRANEASEAACDAKPSASRDARVEVTTSEQRRAKAPYSAYYMRETPAPDAELTQTGPGTLMGEYLRLFWQPICLTEELSDLPKAVTIMSEELVAFRDREGRIGVLQRH